jgi:UDP-glucose 4-epimerase
MKCLVFGSSGFIGQHLVQRLVQEGHDVVRISSAQVDITKREQFSILPRDIDIVFNVTAFIAKENTSENAEKCFRVNALGVFNILRFVEDANIPKLVHSSSGSVYGLPNSFPLKEIDPLFPMSVYGISKVTGEHYCHLFNKVNTTILRYSSVYGVGCARHTVLPLLLNKAKNNEQITLYGLGERTQDFVHVEDVVSANLLAMQAKQSDIFNISSGVETTMKSLAETIIAITKSKSTITYKKEIKDDSRFVFDISKAKKVLGYHPQVSLQAGLQTLC